MRKKLLSVAALAFAAALSTGIAVSASAAEEGKLDGFAITHVAVRTEGTQEKPDAKGIRFKTTVGADAATTYADADCYTNVSFTSSAEGEEKAYSKNVAVELWRSKGDGWNTVVVGMGEADYATEITAKSYIKVSDTEVYETTAKTMSVEEAAAKAMQNGETAEMLAEYTKNAITGEITLDKATATLQAGDTLELTATADAKYGVAWFSSDKTVATVDKNGVVSGVNAGEATITAKMGNVEASCVVTVSARDLYDFETEGQISLTNNFLGCGPTYTDSTTWAIAENVGTEGNHALQKTDDRFSRGMQLRLDASYLEGVFENYDYIAFEFYTNVNESVTYTAEDVQKEGGNTISRASLGTLTGTAAGDLYKYSIVLKKADFESIEYTTGYCVLKFTFADTAPNTWYIDNFKFGSLNASFYDFETSDQIILAENFLGCGATNSVGTWAIAEVGTTGNSALQKTDASWSRGMQFRVEASYLEGVFENYDYIMFDFYTNINESAKFTLEDVDANRTTVSSKTIGNLTGTAEGALYKYNVVLMKADFESISYTSGVSVLKFLFTSTPDTWFIDNFALCEEEVRTLYDFETSDQFALASNFLGCGATGSVGTWVIAEDVGSAGNSALKKTDGSWSRGMQLRISSSYLQEVFATYDSIKFDFYTDINESVNYYVQDLKLNGNNLAENSPMQIGSFSGVAEGSLYKYSVELTKENFESVPYSTGNFVLKFLFASTTPNTWYIDNFELVTNNA